MKLYTATIESYRSKPGTLLAEGTPEEIAKFINSVGDGDEIGFISYQDLEENGGGWGYPPEDWTNEKPWFFKIGADGEYKGGFSSVIDAIEAYGELNDQVIVT